MLQIRTLHTSEYEQLHRMLERSFGHSHGWFQRHIPAIARDDDDALQWSLVGIVNGSIVGHVGVYPLPCVVGSAQVMCGGIGNVATVPEARGKGYMSRLLRAAIEHMDNQKWPASVLWGDRRRYGNFGWERAGTVSHFTVPRRYLNETAPSELREVAAFHEETIAELSRHFDTVPSRVSRPDFSRKLQKAGTRLFVGPDGYVIVRGEQGGNQTIIEIASRAGKEPELIAGLLDYTFGTTATVIVEAVPSARTERLAAVASSWNTQSMAMFRLNDWPEFARVMAPFMAAKVRYMPPFAVTLGMRRDEKIVDVTFTWDGTDLSVQKGRHADETFVLDERHLVRIVFGGPGMTVDAGGPWQHLFPIPIYIPQLDYV